ncbi:MAG: VanZ family protein [Fidelibacterota bacterium]|jgi:VanZ family protein
MKVTRYQIPAILYASLIFLLSSVPQNRIPESPVLSYDKLLHFLEFGILGYLLAIAFFHSGEKRISNNFFFLSAVTGILYAISDEFHQFFVPGRDSSIYDVLADSFGVITSQLIFYGKNKWNLKKYNND